jgi:DNA mismatch endonuclease (patch repair protein)
MPDTLSKKQRSYCMSRVRNKGTDIEFLICSELKRRKLRFKKNYKLMPGSPDIAFPDKKLAIFIDGDFWHGYHFPKWKSRVSPFWRKKISINRSRDLKNFRKIRRMGWRLIRLWQHDLEKNFDKSLNKILEQLT